MAEPFLTVRNGDICLCTQSFGDRDDPPVVLVMGATASMMWWPDMLCRQLAASGRFVVRFDHRDTGASTTVPAGSAAYAVEDLADDVVAILDAYDLPSAHLVGMSLGAFISQLIALRQPERVRTLTLIAAEPLGGDPVPASEMSPAFLEHFGTMSSVDWGNSTSVGSFLERVAVLSSSSGRGYDRAATTERIARELSRTRDMQAAFNHATVGGDWEQWDLRNIHVPVLVIHGAHDPIVPLKNGEAIARQIEGAKLLVLEEAGHELHGADADTITRAIIEHIEG